MIRLSNYTIELLQPEAENRHVIILHGNIRDLYTCSDPDRSSYYEVKLDMQQIFLSCEKVGHYIAPEDYRQKHG